MYIINIIAELYQLFASAEVLTGIPFLSLQPSQTLLPGIWEAQTAKPFPSGGNVMSTLFGGQLTGI